MLTMHHKVTMSDNTGAAAAWISTFRHALFATTLPPAQAVARHHNQQELLGRDLREAEGLHAVRVTLVSNQDALAPVISM